MNIPENFDLIIIGGGPAGLSAGLYAGRLGLKTLLIERALIGGMAALTDKIDNFPTCPIEGTTGAEIAQKILAQALNSGITQIQNNVNKIEKSNDAFLVHLDYDPKLYKTKTIIIASGSEPKKLGLIGEDKFLGKGVSYCAVCDGPFFKEKDIAVIGGGDSALKEAIYLTKYAKKVYIIHRRDEFRAEKDVQNKALSNPKIKFLKSSVAKEIKGSTYAEKIILENTKTKETSELDISGVFFYVGFTPNINFIEKFDIERADDGFVLTNNNMETNIPGVFAAGDIRHKPFKQIVTACGDGATAAHSAYEYVEKTGKA